MSFKLREKIVFVFLLVSSILYSNQNLNLTQNYLRRAFTSIETDRTLAAGFLIQSGAEGLRYPEYYYINEKLNAHDAAERVRMAEGMTDKAGNAFILTSVDYYRRAAEIYTSHLYFDKAVKAYELFFRNNQLIRQEYYADYLDMLFNAGFEDLIKSALDKAVLHLPGSIFNYYKALYSVRYETEKSLHIPLINKLAADKFSNEKIDYLRSYFYESYEQVESLINAVKNADYSDVWKKRIICNVITRNQVLDEEQLSALFKLWLDNGGNSDFRTFEMITLKHIVSLFERDCTTAEKVMEYSGNRILDTDFNGRGEVVYTLNNGVIVKRFYDLNQDGIPELEYYYIANGNIERIVKYSAKNKYAAFNYNLNDSSLNTVNYFEDGIRKRSFLIDTGVYFYKYGEIPDDNELIMICSHEDIYGERLIRNKYFGGEIIYSLIDRNLSGNFDYKLIYENGKLKEGYLDSSSDGLFDTMEIYAEGRLTAVYSRSVSYYPGYDYKEYIFPDRTEKYWDEDFSGEYEIKVIEYNDGRVETYFDINNNTSYDFVQAADNRGNLVIYFIENNRRNQVLSRNISSAEQKRGFRVVAGKNSGYSPVPDKIEFNDSYSGVFYYNGEKYFFNESLITCSFFDYRVLNNKFGIFLFDLR